MSSDARKMAEEALAKWDALPSGDVDDLAAWDVARDGMELFRALLAETAPPDGAEVREAVEMLRLTLGMRDVKHACDDRACSNVALAALNLLAALRGGQKGAE